MWVLWERVWGGESGGGMVVVERGVVVVGNSCELIKAD